MQKNSLAELEHLYTYYGFNHLLAGLDTILIRKWDDARQRGEERAGNLLTEIARLKKSRLPLTDTERASIKNHGILWSPNKEEV